MPKVWVFEFGVCRLGLRGIDWCLRQINALALGTRVHVQDAVLFVKKF